MQMISELVCARQSIVVIVVVIQIWLDQELDYFFVRILRLALELSNGGPRTQLFAVCTTIEQ